MPGHAWLQKMALETDRTEQVQRYRIHELL